MIKYFYVLAFLLAALPSAAQTISEQSIISGILVTIVSLMIILVPVLWIVIKARKVLSNKSFHVEKNYESYLKDLDPRELEILIEARRMRVGSVRTSCVKKALLLAGFVLCADTLLAQGIGENNVSLFSQPGIIITITLILIPLIIAIVFLVLQINRSINRYTFRQKEKEAQQLADYLLHAEGEEIDGSLLRRKASLEFQLKNNELSGIMVAEDASGIILKASSKTSLQFVSTKKKAIKRPNIDSRFSKLILWYLGTATFWLLFGTSVGEYLGIKFVAPDVDQISWLSFGRLRPVHTNAVFWGWSSLAMIGLGHYVVSVVSNRSIASIKSGWIALALINASVISGSILLMAGINNGGGEYREYTWPVMALFGAGLVLTLINFIQTIARRTTHEIYISNWYIVSSIIFTIVIAFIAYWPTWQDGLGETIVQGYYMHQGVGMWFMLFTLGIVYYFLPQQLNKPIYSYSLGILAFWTQILFYTLIGTHHFVFSSIPWWLQTVAIVGSMGMLIPVIAGTTNFLMTFNGDWHKITSSYTLPFFLVGIVFYFTGSFQGTAEAFRYTNLLWHFTDFTVAHSHLTMYGIIAFLLWGAIYALVPRLTGREPSHIMVGVHFWLAFIGLLLYSVPLMIGGTLKGMLWMDGMPFMDSVRMMAPYWLWRAIGGSMMWISHLVYAYNFYVMVSGEREPNLKKLAFEKITQIRPINKEVLAEIKSNGDI